MFLDHLKVGLTNLIIKDDPDYFDQAINGAKVFKGEKSVQTDVYGRSALMVPRDLSKEILFTLTWTSNKFQLNLMAETFIDTVEGLESGDNCMLSFG